MDAKSNQDRLNDDLRLRDTIIHALYLRLKAERETREAVIDAAHSGAAPEVLEAIASDPVPLIDELGKDETVRALVRTFSRRPLPDRSEDNRSSQDLARIIESGR